MKLFYSKLQWLPYEMAELDSYADHTFDNGIAVRISTGEMTHTNHERAYEMHVNHPLKGRNQYPHLTSSDVNSLMNSFDQEVFNN